MKWLTGVLLAAVILEGLALVGLHLRMDRTERLVNEEPATDRLATPAMSAPSGSWVQELEDRLTRLENEVAGARVVMSQPGQVGSDDHEPSDRVAVPPTVIDRNKVPPPTDWATVIDKNLARILIERGLTPYDPGVTEHVRDAGKELREAEEEHVAEQRRLNDLNFRQAIDRDSFEAQWKANDNKWIAARKAVIDDLARALDGGG